MEGNYQCPKGLKFNNEPKYTPTLQKYQEQIENGIDTYPVFENVFKYSYIDKKLTENELKSIEKYFNSNTDDLSIWEEATLAINNLIKEDKTSLLLTFSKYLIQYYINKHYKDNKDKITTVTNVDENDPAGAILIAEMCNLSAKIFDCKFYLLKHYLIFCAVRSGAYIGYNSNEGVFNLYDKRVGVASFHDPNDELKDILSSNGYYFSEWKLPWSGVTRLEEAFVLANDYDPINQNDGDGIKIMRDITSIWASIESLHKTEKEERENYMWDELERNRNNKI